MASESDDLRVVLDELRGSDKCRTPDAVGPPVVEVADEISGTLDTDDLDLFKPGCHQFMAKLTRQMHERGREDPALPGRENPGAGDCFDPLHLARVVKPVPVDKLIEERGEAGDSGGDQESARAQDSPRLVQSPEPIAFVDEVVERSHQQHNVNTAVSVIEVLRLTELGVDPQRAGVIDVAGNRVDQTHRMTLLRQPFRIHSGSPADIQDLASGLRHIPLQQLLRSLELERTREVCVTETADLAPGLVELDDFPRHRRHEAFSPRLAEPIQRITTNVVFGPGEVPCAGARREQKHGSRPGRRRGASLSAGALRGDAGSPDGDHRHDQGDQVSDRGQRHRAEQVRARGRSPVPDVRKRGAAE